LSHLMKVFVADPEVAGRVTETFTVATPGPVKELLVTSVIRLHKYPALTTGRTLDRS